ncbi:hypothetical protein DEA8626_00898 [Defluviimonas aquaemixtae]|uniref:Uncharacterized protein n=1 Tax=Albidovulum aquaemixtae TaxID=1542388 RepID=A0A2R8B4D8_9RHOB|nr:hypothetical protein [Defluviimonas aquaemixtae]SPH17380.1 hypothetical protein DEA8626_00898 [Defluviimonas aquaemixtae]
MIELAFVACLLADPTSCRDESLLFADVAILTCLFGAQSQLAVWNEAHLDWTIERWSCRVRDLEHLARRT